MSETNRLDALKVRFDAACSTHAAFQGLEDGQYTCRTSEAYLHQDESGEVQAVFAFSVVSGQAQAGTLVEYTHSSNAISVASPGAAPLPSDGAVVPADDTADDAVFLPGDRVRWKRGSGVVLKLTSDGSKAVCEQDNGKKSRVALSSLEMNTSEGDDIEVGQAVDVDGRGVGVVVQVDEANALAHVELEVGGKAVASADEITILRAL